MNRFALTFALSALIALAFAAQAFGVWALDPPTNVTPPTITGTTQPGNQLTCSPGIWTGSPSPTPTGYKWTRDNVDISGATSSTYTLTDADVGHEIRCVETVSNGVPPDASKASDPVTPSAPSSGGGGSGGDSGGGGQVTLPAETAVIRAPSTKSCASKRNFKVHIRSADGVTYTGATVFVNNKQVKVVKQSKLTAPVDLRGLFKGRFTVKIVVDTSDGRQITGKRKYKTCTRGTGKSKKKPKL